MSELTIVDILSSYTSFKLVAKIVFALVKIGNHD